MAGQGATSTLAPFHLLAYGGTAHAHQGRQWHMQILARVSGTHAERLRHLESEAELAAATDGWLTLTTPGEGLLRSKDGTWITCEAEPPSLGPVLTPQSPEATAACAAR